MKWNYENNNNICSPTANPTLHLQQGHVLHQVTQVSQMGICIPLGVLAGGPWENL